MLQAANGYGASAGYANGYAGNGAVAAAAVQPLEHRLPAGKQSFKLSADEYRRAHDLVVEGHDVPDPLQEFDSVGFPRAIMDEVLQHLPARAQLAGLTPEPHTHTHARIACRRLVGDAQLRQPSPPWRPAQPRSSPGFIAGARRVRVAPHTHARTH